MTIESLKGTMLASAQPDVHSAAVPMLAGAGFPGKSRRIRRRRARGLVFLERTVSIADTKAGAVEADNHQ